MKDTLCRAMALARTLGADFADVRVKDIRIEALRMEDGVLTAATHSRSMGYGVRVYAGGAPGFAAGNDLDAIEDTVRAACEIARASALLMDTPEELDEKPEVQGMYATPVGIDPFGVDMPRRIALLEACHRNMHSAWETHAFNTEIRFRTMGNIEFRRDTVTFADTQGSYIEQDFVQCTGNLAAVCIAEGDTQTRKYINVTRGGYETLEAMDLPNRAFGLAQEAAVIIEAPDCPSGEFDIILTPRQMFLQIHESVGHPTELDRILGSEAAFAGRSFITTADVPKGFRYGSEEVTIIADAHCPGGLGTFGYDDEGVAAQCVTLIDKGKFVGLQTSRAFARQIGVNSGGAGLSDGWRNLPIVRMTNINMLPGNKTMDELIAGIEYGFIFDENKSWSIDDLRINFQFACEIAHEIKNGKRTGRVFKNPIYAGKTTEFWASCDGVGNADTWELVGVPNCGKGQPVQMMRVSHGSSPARFRKVKVGVQDVG